MGGGEIGKENSHCNGQPKPECKRPSPREHEAASSSPSFSGEQAAGAAQGPWTLVQLSPCRAHSCRDGCRRLGGSCGVVQAFCQAQWKRWRSRVSLGQGWKLFCRIVSLPVLGCILVSPHCFTKTTHNFFYLPLYLSHVPLHVPSAQPQPSFILSHSPSLP